MTLWEVGRERSDHRFNVWRQTNSDSWIVVRVFDDETDAQNFAALKQRDYIKRRSKGSE